ncbi:ammonia-forming cytochrome c nitrite reductase subunit c552 [Lujinxingia vulgaris]|uniref:nitrite reductase (cytochrome; ammonia-forming) n=2 Tax=Lujinxingia vulgaris TaxID=2600176 RepID=A0A5C6XD77_9DELT|nr:ammonia-forming cytochrome c nitrite reductase subunit c552 [Lujinxingia vulgaris]TXD38398.1 ammonia-forming cytochrome c nitrite reductase subunit c552 [Lujinxingia vulgaris]
MSQKSSETPRKKFPLQRGYIVAVALTAGVTIIIVALLMNIFERRTEGQTPFYRVVEVDDETVDPKIWAQNWPHQYDSYMRTVDHERTRYGGSDAVPMQKLDKDPWLKKMWSGYAFSVDYREARGHAYMLLDQEETERVTDFQQPGACLHCHASVIPAYRFAGDGDVWAGFVKMSGMPYEEARNIVDDSGEKLIEHPVACVDCHNPETMSLRVSRPAFKAGIAALMKHERGIEDYDVNRDASRQEMRTFVCGQCHVEYYFDPQDKHVIYPWAQGINIDNEIAYYDEVGFNDWTHGYTGTPMLKAQHPEFELYNAGTHAAAGVACADCHMPYERMGAMKVSNHHVRSPLLDMASSCMTCHGGSESDLRDRVHTIQDTTQGLIDRASNALVEMMDDLALARAMGATPEDLEEAYKLHREAQFRLDWVYSENSRGFHAPQEAARVLADSIDQARQAQLEARRIIQKLEAEGATRPDHVEGAEVGTEKPVKPEPAPIEGVTPAEEAPAGVY